MRVLFAALVLLAAALAGCATPPDEPAPTTSTPPPTDAPAPEPVDVQVIVGDGVNEGQVTLYFLKPAKLELVAGQPVRLTLVNEGRGPHDLMIDGLDVHIETIGGGETSEPVEFTPTEAGTFKMYCTISAGSPLSHEDHGMKGEVVVS